MKFIWKYALKEWSRGNTDAASNIRVSRQTLADVQKNKTPLVTRRKGGAKVFHIKWIEDCQTS